jgi:hypothetical protein
MKNHIKKVYDFPAYLKETKGWKDLCTAFILQKNVKLVYSVYLICN